MPALESVRIESAARRAAAFLDEARRRAVLDRRDVVVHCRQRDGALELDDTREDAATFRVPEGVAIASCKPEEVRFRPQGFATGAAIELRDLSGRVRRLTVGAFTGLTRVDAVF